MSETTTHRVLFCIGVNQNFMALRRFMWIYLIAPGHLLGFQSGKSY